MHKISNTVDYGTFERGQEFADELYKRAWSCHLHEDDKATMRRNRIAVDRVFRILFHNVSWYDERFKITNPSRVFYMLKHFKNREPIEYKLALTEGAVFSYSSTSNEVKSFYDWLFNKLIGYTFKELKPYIYGKATLNIEKI